MKEKDIRHVERDLSFKRIKSQKKYSMLILCITILTCVLMQLGFQMTFGIQATLRENRKAIYGEWGRILAQMNQDTKDIINNNPFLEKKGVIEIYGALDGDYWENTQSNIGTMGEEAWELGRLELKEGRLPKKQ